MSQIQPWSATSTISVGAEIARATYPYTDFHVGGEPQADYSEFTAIEEVSFVAKNAGRSVASVAEGLANLQEAVTSRQSLQGLLQTKTGALLVDIEVPSRVGQLKLADIARGATAPMDVVPTAGGLVAIAGLDGLIHPDRK